jgi:tetratricopeptide (TPR) repeat protein
MILSGVVGHAQQSKIDSLEKILLNSKDDSLKVNLLIKISNKYWGEAHLNKAMEEADTALALAKKLNFNSGIAAAYNLIGLLNQTQGNYAEALKNFFASLKIEEQSGDKKAMAGSYNNMGIIYEKQHNYTEAFKNQNQALKLFQEIGDTADVASSYGNIGNIFYFQGNYKEALKNQEASLAIDKKRNEEYGMAVDYLNIASIYEQLASTEKNSDSAKNEWEYAVKYNSQALNTFKEMSMQEGMIAAYINNGSFFSHQNKFALAENYFDTAMSLSRQINSKDNIRDCYQGLSAMDSAMGNYSRAFLDYKLYIAYRDSLLNEENTKKIVQEEMNYSFDKKESEQKAIQDKKDVIAESDKRRKNIVLLFVAGGLLLVIVFSVFLFNRFRITQQQKIIIEQQKFIVEEKQKEILDSIQYAKRIQQSLLPTEKYIEKNLDKLRKQNT